MRDRIGKVTLDKGFKKKIECIVEQKIALIKKKSPSLLGKSIALQSNQSEKGPLKWVRR